MRLIDAEALIERYGEPCHSFADVIEDMPTIDAVLGRAGGAELFGGDRALWMKEEETDGK